MSLERILVAYDATPGARAALTEAAAIARAESATLRLIWVVALQAGAYGPELPPIPPVGTALDRANGGLEAVRHELAGQGISAVETVVVPGNPADEILADAETSRPRLIVVGSRGLSGAGRFLLGSVSDAIVHHAPCSVLVVKGSPAAEVGGGPASSPKPRGATRRPARTAP